MTLNIKIKFMETETVILELSKTHLVFAQSYAEKNGMTITDLFINYLNSLERMEKTSDYPELDKITGLIPDNIDGEKIYQDYLTEKYNQ